MTLGVKIFTEGGLLQVSDQLMVPQFIGKITTVNDNITHADQGNEFGYEDRSYSGVAPNFNGRDVMIFWHLPENVWWVPVFTHMPAISSGGTFGMFAFCAPGTVITGTPVGYVFALGHVIRGSETYAMRLWNEVGTLMFDSSTPHLNIDVIGTGFSTPIGSNHTQSMTLSAKPAFLFPVVSRVEEVFTGILNSPDEMADRKEWVTAAYISGSNVTLRLLKVFDGEYLASDSSRAGYSEAETYGNTTGLILPCISGAIYD